MFHIGMLLLKRFSVIIDRISVQIKVSLKYRSLTFDSDKVFAFYKVMSIFNETSEQKQWVKQFD